MKLIFIFFLIIFSHPSYLIWLFFKRSVFWFKITSPLGQLPEKTFFGTAFLETKRQLTVPSQFGGIWEEEQSTGKSGAAPKKHKEGSLGMLLPANSLTYPQHLTQVSRCQNH